MGKGKEKSESQQMLAANIQSAAECGISYGRYVAMKKGLLATAIARKPKTNILHSNYTTFPRVVRSTQRFINFESILY